MMSYRPIPCTLLDLAPYQYHTWVAGNIFIQCQYILRDVSQRVRSIEYYYTIGLYIGHSLGLVKDYGLYIITIDNNPLVSIVNLKNSAL